jgi:Protein of unknown function (DUF2934)
MATRQRTRASRKPSSNQSSGEQPSGTTATEERTQDSEVLRASFDTTPFEASDGSTSDAADTMKVTFVGQQLGYKDRSALIAQAAYLRAEQRGFSPGYELDDWLAAEKEVDALLSPDGNAK